MSELSAIPEYLFYAVMLILAVWPGYGETKPVDPPKKGYWTAASMFWPLRKAYRTLVPANPSLSSAIRTTLGLAAILAFAFKLSIRLVPAVAHIVTPHGYAIELAAVAFLVGRASGFWSADRRLKAPSKD
jgi:hypothetical protein